MIKLNEDMFDSVFATEIPSAIMGIDIEDEITQGPAVGMDTGVAELLLHLINDENEAIQNYNSARATLATDPNYSEFIEVMDDIATEELNHVGQLQALLKRISPNASAIEAGEEEAEGQLTEDLDRCNECGTRMKFDENTGLSYCPKCKSKLHEQLNKSKSLVESVEVPYFKAFITNLGKYNEGELVGEWVDFPIDENEFESILQSIGISNEPDEDGNYYEEWFVTDYECNLPGFEWQELGEYPSYDTLQEYGEMVESIDDLEAVSNALEVTGDLKEAIEGLSNGDIYYYPGVTTDEELGYMIVDEMYGGVDQLDQDVLENCFDYEMLGRELGFESYEGDNEEEISAGEYWCGDENASDYDIGVAYVDAVGIDGVSNIEQYFDYGSFGSDYTHYGFTFTSDGCIEQR